MDESGMASLGGTKEEDVADSIEMSAVAPVYAMHPTSLAELNLPTFEDYVKELKSGVEADRSAALNAQVEEALQETRQVVEKYSNEAVEQWNREIDGLLTFNGLFSAVLTAFNVQSYQLLQPSPTDQTNAVLAQISSQIEAFSLSPSFVNSTRPAFDTSAYLSQFQVPLYAIQLNILWFSSLVLSLASAAIGIIVKQWLKEYSSGLYGTEPEVARRRQYRLNNLLKWRVPFIIAMLPVLLLISLILFLTGLMILLYSIHRTVACVVTIVISILLLFIAVTTILLTVYRTCSYHSPQATAISMAWTAVRRLLALILIVAVSFVVFSIHVLIRTTRRCISFTGRFKRHVLSSMHIIRAFVTWCIVKLLYTPSTNWHAAEQNTAIMDAVNLDFGTTAAAYETTLDKRHLGIADTCLSRCTNFDWFFDAPSWAFVPFKNRNHDGAPAHRPQDVQDAEYNLVDRIIRGALTQAKNENLKGEMDSCLWFLSDNIIGSGFMKDEYYRIPDKLLGPFAVLAMGHHVNTSSSNSVWSHLYHELILRDFHIDDLPIRRLVIVSTVRRMKGMLDDSSRLARGIERFFNLGNQWEMKSLQQHLQVVWKMTKPSSSHIFPPSQSSENIQTFRYSVHLLRSILVGMRWKRSPWISAIQSDISEYLLLLRAVANIAESEDEPLNHEMDMVIFSALETGFQRLTGADGWEDTRFPDEDEMNCQEILIKLRSRIVTLSRHAGGARNQSGSNYGFTTQVRSVTDSADVVAVGHEVTPAEDYYSLPQSSSTVLI